VLLFIFYVVDYWTFDRKDCGDYAHIAILFGLLAIMFCLRLLLWNLYHIYTVMQIEADIRNLDYTLALLIEDRVRIGAFVSADSTLVNFWIYHTIPWLELMSDAHDRIKRKLGDQGVTLEFKVPCFVDDACDGFDNVSNKLAGHPHQHWPQWVHETVAIEDDQDFIRKLLVEDGSFMLAAESPVRLSSSQGPSAPPKTLVKPEPKAVVRRKGTFAQTISIGRMNFSQRAIGGHLMGAGREHHHQHGAGSTTGSGSHSPSGRHHRSTGSPSPSRSPPRSPRGESSSRARMGSGSPR